MLAAEPLARLQNLTPPQFGYEPLILTRVQPPNNSLERTQPQQGFMYDLAVLRRSARSR